MVHWPELPKRKRKELTEEEKEERRKKVTFKLIFTEEIDINLIYRKLLFVLFQIATDINCYVYRH